MICPFVKALGMLAVNVSVSGKSTDFLKRFLRIWLECDLQYISKILQRLQRLKFIKSAGLRKRIKRQKSGRASLKFREEVRLTDLSLN